MYVIIQCRLTFQTFNDRKTFYYQSSITLDMNTWRESLFRQMLPRERPDQWGDFSLSMLYNFPILQLILVFIMTVSAIKQIMKIDTRTIFSRKTQGRKSNMSGYLKSYICFFQTRSCTRSTRARRASSTWSTMSTP